MHLEGLFSEAFYKIYIYMTRMSKTKTNASGGIITDNKDITVTLLYLQRQILKTLKTTAAANPTPKKTQNNILIVSIIMNLQKSHS